MKLTVQFKGFRELLLENVFITEDQWNGAIQEASKKHQRVIDILIQRGELSPALGQKVLKAGLLIAEGRSLLQLGLGSADEIDTFLAQPATSLVQNSVAATMKEHGVVAAGALEQVIETWSGSTIDQFGGLEASSFLLELIPPWILEKQTVLPIFKLDQFLLVAMVNPDDLPQVDDLRHITRHELVAFKTDAKTIRGKLEEGQPQPTKTGMVDNISEAIMASTGADVQIASDAQRDKDYEELEAKLDENEAPVIRIVDSILVQALKEKASDIHIEPKDDQIMVRLRINGMLKKLTSLPVHLRAAVASRLKIMSKLDIAEKRVPQDGRARLRIDGRTIDFRVSTLPCTLGEKVVLRILDKSASARKLEDMGFDATSLQAFQDMIHHTHGIVYVTGPTGSGKTSTLYAALNALEDPARNVITVEDPVEYELPWATQVSINTAQGLTFSRVLRAILRQDPDIILLGETRDEETARIAIEAALTGHLVLTTLHANSAPQTIARLTEMGIEPFLIGPAVVGVVAQRLIRTICPVCKDTYAPSPETLAVMGLDREPNLRYFQGVGCDTCQGSGYLSRRAIFEVMPLNDLMRDAIVRNAPLNELRQLAIANGMSTLLESALQLLRQEGTTVEEVLRVVFAKEKEKRCPYCQYVVDDTFVRCPSCQSVLKHVCKGCHRELDPKWTVCPGCGTPVVAEANVCYSCLTQMRPDWTVCLSCGAPRRELSSTELLR